MKTFYVTTAIPYANAKPHIGNALDYLQADIVARYQKQQGKDVRFQAGTDEHGNKIAAKAREAGMNPQAYVDSMYGNFKAMAAAVGAEFTDFIRTTDEHHVRACQEIWKKLEPYLYKGEYEGWYCTGHEAFFTEKEVQETGGICPDHQTPYERLKEENYFFKLSAFSDKIRELIEKHKLDIVPHFRGKEILNLIDSGLHDVSFSRPARSLSWGVPVPGDDSQVMYVWVDALSNYITVLGYPDDDAWKTVWPADVQVVGKDILRFHALIWPAMLLALEVPLPKKILAHGFVNVGGAKISKTVGNVIDPIEIIETYGQDAFRYFFSRHIPAQDDGDFTWEKFENAYNNELGNELGNLVQRIVSMTNRYQDGVLGELPQREHDERLYHEAMKALKFDEAINIAWAAVRELNVYLEEVKPWEVAKTKDTDQEAAAHLNEILGYSAVTLLQVSRQLEPFLPRAAGIIQRIFEGGVIKPYQGVLFPKIYNHTPNPAAK